MRLKCIVHHGEYHCALHRHTLAATKFFTCSGVSQTASFAGNVGCPAQSPAAPELPIRVAPLALGPLVRKSSHLPRVGAVMGHPVNLNNGSSLRKDFVSESKIRGKFYWSILPIYDNESEQYFAHVSTGELSVHVKNRPISSFVQNILKIEGILFHSE